MYLHRKLSHGQVLGFSVTGLLNGVPSFFNTTQTPACGAGGATPRAMSGETPGHGRLDTLSTSHDRPYQGIDQMRHSRQKKRFDGVNGQWVWLPRGRFGACVPPTGLLETNGRMLLTRPWNVRAFGPNVTRFVESRLGRVGSKD